MAVEQVKERIPGGATCVVIFHDRGERYLDTIYCDEWVAEHFGDIAHLWQDQPENNSHFEEKGGPERGLQSAAMGEVVQFSSVAAD